MANPSEISERILRSVLARRLAPGARLGEQQLAQLFGCSRTIVREALTRLATRGIVEVSARRGWFVIEPSQAEAREAFEARRIIETGLLRSGGPLTPAALARLRTHVAQQQDAVLRGDVGTRSFLLGDFHVCLAEALGNRLLAETLRDLTARTSLVATHHQSAQDASQSCAEHAAIVDALAEGDRDGAEQLLAEHLGTWQDKLHPPAPTDELARLRHALQFDAVDAVPPPAAHVLHTSPASPVRRSRAPA